MFDNHDDDENDNGHIAGNMNFKWWINATTKKAERAGIAKTVRYTTNIVRLIWKGIVFRGFIRERRWLSFEKKEDKRQHTHSLAHSHTLPANPYRLFNVTEHQQ